MNIRKHPNYSAIHCRGVPRGRPLAFQRRITLYYCRSYSPIGHPQGAPLRWVCLVCAFDFMHERHEIYDVWIFNTMHRERKGYRIIRLFVQKRKYIDYPLSSKQPQKHPPQGRPSWAPGRLAKANDLL